MLLGLLFLPSIGCGNPSIELPGEQPGEVPPPATPQHPSPPAGTSLFLQVVDDSGNPVAGAAVSARGALFSVDSSGHLLLENLPSGRFLSRVDALGFTSATTVVELREGDHVGAQVKLLRLPDPIPFEAEAGGILETPQVRVTIPAGAVVDALGQPVTGTVQATIAPLDPTRQLESMPGPLEGITVADGQTVQLESFFMAEVSLWSNGAPVQLAPGKSATLEFLLPEALASQFHAGDTIPAWWFDLDAGQWREEGAGIVQPASTQPGRLAWVVQVRHFTWWNCDAPWTDKSCVDVFVVDGAGTPARGAAVIAEGLSYMGRSTSYTGADGHACVEIKRGNEARIVAAQGAFTSDGVTVTGSTTAALCGGGSCTDVRLTVPGLVCAPGAYESCSYSGPAGTEGQGTCRASRRQCNILGSGWGACEGEVLPTAENCRTPFDEDCDGTVNEGCSCSEQEGLPCYGGPEGTQGVGICHGGTVGCDRFGNVACLGQQLPQPESCSTLADDNCNGRHEGCEPVSQWFWGLGVPATSCTSSSQLLGLAVDGAGNTLLLSRFTGTTTLGGTVFTGDENDLLLVKVSKSGLPTWARLIDREEPASSSSYDSIEESLAVDATGNVLVTGGFSGTLHVEGSSLVSSGVLSSFVVKFAPSGGVAWAQRFGGGADSDSAIGAVATDAAGNVAVLGIFSSTLTLGGTTYSSPGDYLSSLYVAKLDAATGEPLWSRNLAGRLSWDVIGLYFSYPTAIEVDDAGDVLIAAVFNGEFEIDSFEISSYEPTVFVARFEGTTGNMLWLTHAFKTLFRPYHYPRLKAAGAGSVLVSSYSSYDSGGTYNLAKLSASGETLWSVASASSDSIEYWWSIKSGAQHLAVDAEGRALISGTFSGRIDLGGGLHESDEPAAFVAWYDSEGRYVMDHVFPLKNTPGSAWGTGVGVDGEGSVLLGGWFSGTGDFGMGPVTSCANTTFLLKVDPTPPTPSHFNPIITRGVGSLYAATPGQVLTFEVEAMDPEGSALTFSWAANAGTPGTPVDGASVSRLPWTAPACERVGAHPTITLTVTNAFGLTATTRFHVEGLPSCGWTSTSSMASPRAEHTATLLLDGRVLVSGGYGTDDYPIRVAEVYDSATGTWSSAGSMVWPHRGHTATRLTDGRVLVAGGMDGGALPSSKVEVYDPATGTWGATGSMASPRWAHTATLLLDGRVLVSGGASLGADPIAAAEVYDPATGTWSSVGSMSSPRREHSATLLPDGKVLVTGGADISSALATAEVYDPATGTWSTASPMASPRWEHTATLLLNGKVLVAGGTSDNHAALATAEVYDPATGTWSATGPMTSMRRAHTATLLVDGKVFVAGGREGITFSLTAVEVYDPATGTWSSAGFMARPRDRHTATLLLNGKVLVCGGSYSDPLETALLYTP